MGTLSRDAFLAISADATRGEFYQWETVYCSRILKGLCTALPTPFTTLSLAPWDRKPTPNERQDPFPASDLRNATFEIDNYEITRITKALEDVIDVPTDAFDIVSPYESSPLTDRNVFRGDDAVEMPFVPFADDENFNQHEHMEHYTDFAWIKLQDTKHEVIFLEIARRLNEQHGLSFDEIDEMGLCSIQLRPGRNRKEKPGLLAVGMRRDFPPWPALTLPVIGKVDSDALPPLHTQVEGVVSLLCNNLNCLVGLCPTHITPSAVPGQTVARVPSHRFFDRDHEPCGDDCFLLGDASEEDVNRWSKDDKSLLELLLLVLPDAIPCNLAQSCMKPCREIFEQRRRIIPDEDIIDIRPRKLVLDLDSTKWDDLHDSDLWTPNAPCSHPGELCVDAKLCACVFNGTLCQAACRCETVPCHRRRKGCQCKKTNCQKASCPCFRANRECDPEICTVCNVREAGRCGSGSIQRGIWKSLEVKESIWGRGVFAVEPIAKGKFISEYVGELVREATSKSREDLSLHRGRNYLFGLNQEFSLDSTYLGNETRFMNHARGAGSNCQSDVLLVNGEHRIAFWATKNIAQGEEIVFDYGEQFFTV